jgi:septal ring factor EnvC (AmiA/AmiB activator)
VSFVWRFEGRSWFVALTCWLALRARACTRCSEGLQAQLAANEEARFELQESLALNEADRDQLGDNLARLGAAKEAGERELGARLAALQSQLESLGQQLQAAAADKAKLEGALTETQFEHEGARAAWAQELEAANKKNDELTQASKKGASLFAVTLCDRLVPSHPSAVLLQRNKTLGR